MSERRAAAFWLGCIPARTGVTYAAATVKDGVKRTALRVSAAGLGATWLLQPAQILEYGEQFQGPIWWKDQRTLHGVLWSLYALTGDWRFLAADTVGGAVNWFINEDRV